ncbi:MAG: ATP-binding protein [Lachnospiraceae bacterium]|nr:ATP-binding protein [Lachnospiraceae bacterium]
MVRELTLEAKTEKLDELIGIIDEELEAAGCDPKTQMKIDLSVEEIFVNIASYAYGEDGGVVDIRIEIDENSAVVRLSFADSGIPFDPLAKEDPDVSLPAEERGVGGLGIFLTKKSMDGVSYEYRDGRNILTMHKAF